MPLLVHGEVTDPAIDVFDREAVFVERVMKPLRRAFPALKVVFEHITTKEGAEYVRDAEGPIAATITPQHLLYNRNAIFQGGVRPHWYCLPILKRETHRQALVAAATSGSPRFFLGTDSAPHARGLKEHACGCAGCYTALHAMELYATAFDAAGALDKLEGFASFHGPDFYGLPRNTGKLTLVRETYQVPDEVPFGNTSWCRWPPARHWPGALRSECRAGMAGRNDPRRKSPAYIYKQGFFMHRAVVRARFLAALPAAPSGRISLPVRSPVWLVRR